MGCKMAANSCAAAPTLVLAFPGALFLGFASMVFMTQSTAIVQVMAMEMQISRSHS